MDPDTLGRTKSLFNDRKNLFYRYIYVAEIMSLDMFLHSTLELIYINYRNITLCRELTGAATRESEWSIVKFNRGS